MITYAASNECILLPIKDITKVIASGIGSTICTKTSNHLVKETIEEILCMINRY